MQIPGFIGPPAKEQSWALGNDVLRNLYLHMTQSGPALVGVPGYAQKLSLGDGLRCRAMFYDNDRCFCVLGGRLYEITYDSDTATFAGTLRGNVANSSQPASIESNRNQLLITSGNHGYVYDLRANGLAKISEEIPEAAASIETPENPPDDSFASGDTIPSPGTRTYAIVYTWTSGEKESLPSEASLVIMTEDSVTHQYCFVVIPDDTPPDGVTGFNIYIDPTGAGTDYHKVNGDTPIPTEWGDRGLREDPSKPWTIDNIGSAPAPPTIASEDSSVIQFPGAVMCGFLDGYFIVFPPDSRNAYISGLNDGTSWDVLDFGVKEGDPGNIKSILIDHREVIVQGDKKTEVWYDSGDADFPLTRRPDASIEQGTAAPWSRVRADNSFFWLGADERGHGIAWRMNGYTPEKVSPDWLDAEWQRYSCISDAIGYSYQESGHIFWVLQFPTEDKTWVYDCNTKMWHERLEWDELTQSWHRHRGQFHAFAFGFHLVGDYENGLIYEQSHAYFDNDGDPIRCVRGFALPRKENKLMFVANPELVGEPGMGMAVSATDPVPGNPQVMFRFSFNGGRTFGSELRAGMGLTGEYGYRCRIGGPMGSGRRPYCEISITAPIRVAWTEFLADVAEGLS